MASRRSTVFDNVDPGLARALETVSRGYTKYRAEPFSGNRPRPKNPSSLHPQGMAMDVNLYDPKTGQLLPNIGAASSASAYQGFANDVYKWALQNDPELAKELVWGGYFAGGGWPQDYMHFQRGGNAPQGGSWDTGFTPDVMKKLGLTNAGGLGEAAAQMSAAGYSPEQIRRAFLSSIASTESPGYDVLYGGEKFSDFSKHPGRDMPIMKDGRVIGHSSAAGKYQFLKGTWAEQAAKHGYKDFSPETQDTAAWNYANDIFKQKAGGSLEEALASGDPGRINAAAQVLNQTWTSLPGGKEQSKGYGNQTFADVYTKALAGTADSPSETGGARFGGSGLGTPETSSPYSISLDKKKDKKDTALEMMAKAASNMGSTMANWQLPQTEPTPQAARVDAPGASLVDPQQTEYRRQLLAQAMARLNNQGQGQGAA